MKGINWVLIGGLTVASGLVATAQAAETGTRGTLKGGSGYEKQLEMSGMSGMAGMSGDHSSTAQPAAKKPKAKAKAKPAKAAKESKPAAKDAAS